MYLSCIVGVPFSGLFLNFYTGIFLWRPRVDPLTEYYILVVYVFASPSEWLTDKLTRQTFLTKTQSEPIVQIHHN